MQMNNIGVIRVGGVCTLLGVAAGLAGAVVGAIHGLGGQDIPLRASADFISLTEGRAAYLVREWLFLAYAVFVVGEGIGLYYLARAAKGLALWGLVAFSVGIVVGIVQDAAVVSFVHQFPIDYAAADLSARPTLEALGRTVWTTIRVQQAVANVLLGLGVVLYSLAVLRARVVSRGFGMVGVIAGIASVFFGVVTAVPDLPELQEAAERIFGLVVLWDLWAGIVMFGFRKHVAVPMAEASA
jgi:hypothetical protein